MGFFSDIIRDSRRTHRTFSLAENMPVDRRQQLSFPDRLRVTDEGGRAARSAVASAPIKRLREESAGFSETAWQDQVQAETVARQVVSPSPAQYIPDGELAQLRVAKEGSPNPEAREQTGSESDETATDASRMTRTESRHGDGSFDVPEVQASASDSSIRESSSERAMSGAGTTAVETQGRQQAGENRAGLATPPGHETPQIVAERHGLSLGQPFQRGLHEPPAATGRENAALRLKEDFVRGAPADPKRLRANTSLGREKSSRARVQAVAEPQVQIGTIEVVVLAQAPPERSAPSETRVPPDPISRHYLRNV